jgi:hypothetical protein
MQEKLYRINRRNQNTVLDVPLHCQKYLVVLISNGSSHSIVQNASTVTKTNK